MHLCATVEAGFDPGFLAKSSHDAYYGIIFRGLRLDDNSLFQSYYLFGISRRGKFSLHSYDGGGKLTLINWLPCKFINQHTALNNILVEMIDSNIVLGINGATVASLTDTRPWYSKGEVGLCVGTLDTCIPEARFRNLRIYEVKELRTPKTRIHF